MELSGAAVVSQFEKHQSSKEVTEDIRLGFRGFCA
jgi:hypothetical protein